MAKLEPRIRAGITLIGPDFFDTDQKGRPLCPIASVFPKFHTIVTGRGIHAMLAEILVQTLRDPARAAGYREFAECDEIEVYGDAVALLIRDWRVLIRPTPEDIDRIFEADRMIQHFLPKNRIQFIGMHLDPVRRMLRDRGESWRISAPPRTDKEIGQYIQASRVQVETGLTAYYNAPAGGRFVTYEEFMRIRPLIVQDRGEALARLREILDMLHRVNDTNCCELSFLLPTGKSVDVSGLQRTAALIEGSNASSPAGEILSAFDKFAADLADAAGPELTADDEHNPVWRTTLFCRLYDIDPRDIQELALGLSPEFHLNVRWLPGASVDNGQLVFEPAAPLRAKGLVEYFWKKTGKLVSINVGHVESPQSGRDLADEERDVYLVVISTGREEDIRLVRLMKWDVYHRIKMGTPLQRAIEDALQYRDYIFDRLRAASNLGFPLLIYNEIRLEEDLPGLGRVPVIFFERQYVPGMVTNKIPLSHYKQADFIVNLSRLLGLAAAFSLVLGRASTRTGGIFFDDGDELIRYDEDGIPKRLVIIETTGSFANWTTPLVQMLPQCLARLAGHLQKAAGCGTGAEPIAAAVHAFAEALAAEVARVQALVASSKEYFYSLFFNRPLDPGGVRDRWNAILGRIEATNVEELKKAVFESEELRGFGLSPEPRSENTP